MSYFEDIMSSKYDTDGGGIDSDELDDSKDLEDDYLSDKKNNAEKEIDNEKHTSATK